ncbi:MAG: TraR/DksA family transcriptional regulator [Rhodospirillaceae bacterium]
MAKTLTKAAVDKFRARLEAMRGEVLRDSELTEDERKPVTLDQSMVGRLSRMDALQNQAMALEAERRRGLEVQRIDAALKRIDTGDFGYCLVCGEDIEPKRLEQDPTAPSCIACAQDAG